MTKSLQGRRSSSARNIPASPDYLLSQSAVPCVLSAVIRPLTRQTRMLLSQVLRDETYTPIVSGNRTSDTLM
jgi:hypothetical protein